MFYTFSVTTRRASRLFTVEKTAQAFAQGYGKAPVVRRWEYGNVPANPFIIATQEAGGFLPKQEER